MLPIMPNYLGKAATREVMSLAALMLGSGTLVFNEGLGGAVFRTFESWSWKGVLSIGPMMYSLEKGGVVLNLTIWRLWLCCDHVYLCCCSFIT